MRSAPCPDSVKIGCTPRCNCQKGLLASDEVPGTYNTRVLFFLRRTELQELREPRELVMSNFVRVEEKGSSRYHDGKRASHEDFHRASALHTNSSYGRIAHRSHTHGATWTLLAVSECMRGREMGHVGMLRLLLKLHATKI